MTFKASEKRKEWYRKRAKTKRYQDYCKKWREANKEYFIKWARENRIKTRAYVKKWRMENKTYCNKKTLEWYSNHPWARHHAAAKSRCTNVNSPKYATYGGRGIKFQLTMAETKALWERDSASQMNTASIHRKDNDGNYEYSNCEFIEMGVHSSKTWLGRKHSEKTKQLISKKAKERVQLWKKPLK